ncbi:MAG TPA: ABC transporter ATP-binding protein [Kofleriaceae bacterium]|nr:ABC transporter ATP-binding protein [Kofleriaceae bacterium]
MTAVIETRGLGKDYGDVRALDALDLTINRGEIFGLLGPNGAGKTTAISMMCGVRTPSRGTTEIAGIDIRARPHEAKRKLGYAPQELALYEELSAIENLSFFGSIYGLRGADLGRAVTWALEVAGLGGRGKDLVREYSGGMKRRLNLACAILHQPEVLILDEPTVGVDPQSRSYLFDTIRRLTSERDMTVVYTSHYMEEVEALCRRVAIIDHGKLLAQDTVEALISGHGSGLDIDIDDACDADAALAAASRSGTATLSGRRIHVEPAGKGLGEMITAIEATGAHIRGLRTLEPSLETVFLTLTGHSLRDDP